MIPHHSNGPEIRVKTITPRQQKSFRNIIEEARQRIVEGLDNDAQKAVEGNQQRANVRREFKGNGKW